MIRIGQTRAPDLFEADGISDMRRVLMDHLRRDSAEREQRRAPIEESFFYSPELRNAVSERSRGKCVFCEERGYDHVVEHFRPYRDARDLTGSPLKDFYAWLAYEWDNLILVCPACARAKGTTFPVSGDRAPYLADLAEVRRRERGALLIDPLRDNPERHFDFLLDGWCVPLTPWGRATASVVDLNRSDLVARRQENFVEFVVELGDAVGGADQSALLEIFNFHREFLGGRSNILKRLLLGFVYRGERLSGAARTLPKHLARWLENFSDDDRKRLIERAEEMRAEDADRREASERTEARADLPDPPASMSFRTPRSERFDPVASVTLRDFKGVNALELKLPRSRRASKGAPCLMLLGENAVGKSSILQGIALALLGGPDARRLRVPPDEILSSLPGERWDQMSAPSARVQVQFQFRSPAAEFHLDGALKRIHGGREPTCIVLGYGPRRYFDPKKSIGPQGAYGRVQTLFNPLATIPHAGTWLNEISPDRFGALARVMREVLTLAEDDDLVRDAAGRICVRLAGHPVPVERLSEGYRSIFAMVTDIVREVIDEYPILEEAEAVVLIDEIETHLHPRWKMRVMRSLRRALPRVQFIVTTHDPLCLRGMEDGEVVVLQRDADERIVVLDGLPSIQGMRADQLLTSDYFGLSSTIDPETELMVAQYADRVADLPIGEGKAADELIAHLVLGDSAREQIIHEALRRFIEERERPTGALRPDVRAKAIQAVLEALRAIDGEPSAAA